MRRLLLFLVLVVGCFGQDLYYTKGEVNGLFWGKMKSQERSGCWRVWMLVSMLLPPGLCQISPHGVTECTARDFPRSAMGYGQRAKQVLQQSSQCTLAHQYGCGLHVHEVQRSFKGKAGGVPY